jgi:hypothetical protein
MDSDVSVHTAEVCAAPLLTHVKSADVCTFCDEAALLPVFLTAKPLQ